MRSEYEIYMDFRKAKQLADRLRGIASKMAGIADNSLEGTLSSIRNEWTGENADAYISKGEAIRGKISMTSSDIRRIADTIEAIAERTRNAELAAISIAEK